jgi:hypothetical protein
MKKVRGWVVSAALVGAALVAAPTSARAESISFNQNIGLSRAVMVTVSGLRNGSIYAGELNWSFNQPVPSGYDQSFYAYCVDLLTNASLTQNVTIGSTSGLTGGKYVADAGARVAWLFESFAADVHAAAQPIQAAALQVAIWEALYDTTLDLTSGNLKLLTSEAIMNQAASYLSQLASANYAGSVATVLFASNGQSQLMNPVPEPSTLVLMGAGFLFMAWAMRRKQLGLTY